jgi:hypothetical protein
MFSMSLSCIMNSKEKHYFTKHGKIKINPFTFNKKYIFSTET